MRKEIIIFGIVSMLILIMGIVFKLMHWPYANVTRLVGLISLILFFLTYLIGGVSKISSKTEKAYALSGSFSMALLLLSIIFKVNHLQLTNSIMIASEIGILMTAILMLIDSFNEKDKAKQSFKVLFSFILLLMLTLIVVITIQ